MQDPNPDDPLLTEIVNFLLLRLHYYDSFIYVLEFKIYLFFFCFLKNKYKYIYIYIYNDY